MLIYNVTIKVDWSIRDAWVQWMLDEHIPEVLGTGCFVKHQFVRLLEIDDDEGATYAAQYYAETREKYDEYIDRYSTQMRERGLQKWGDKFIAFRSLMEVVH